MAAGSDQEAVRKALMQLPEVAAQENLQTPPPWREVYLPREHKNALSLESTLVVGMRGAGKSFWTACLNNPEYREFILKSYAMATGIKIRVGFGLEWDNKLFPSPIVLKRLVRNYPATEIWRTVVLRSTLESLDKKNPFSSNWEKAVEWTCQQPQKYDELLSQCDAELATGGEYLLMLFDALDRLSTDWQDVRTFLAAAMQIALEHRSRRRIRMKFFLRPEMISDDTFWNFTDSSKLKHSEAHLVWTTADLYGMLFQFLGNSETCGADFRKKTAQMSPRPWRLENGVYQVPMDLPQKEVMAMIAGPFMGLHQKRGYTHSWIPTHLADAKGMISPRSFLLAFRKAAHITASDHPEHEHPLHYQAIFQGVVQASAVRVDEIREDFPWVGPLLEAMRGMTVPCTSGELVSNWTPEVIREMERVNQESERLPPRRFNQVRRNRTEALINDMEELGVLYRTGDRINIPDIFRVGFGIRRKGGVKPPPGVRQEH